MLLADEVTRRDRESAARRAKAAQLDPQTRAGEAMPSDSDVRAGSLDCRGRFSIGFSHDGHRAWSTAEW
jgi:hypothetical protein